MKWLKTKDDIGDNFMFGSKVESSTLMYRNPSNWNSSVQDIWHKFSWRKTSLLTRKPLNQLGDLDSVPTTSEVFSFFVILDSSLLICY